MWTVLRWKVADIAQALDTHHPDVTVIDNNCWGAAAALAGRGVSWAQVATFLLPLTTRDAPPFGLGLRPAKGWPGHVRDASLRTGALPLFDSMLPPINRLRASLAVARVAHVPDLYMQAPLVLCYTAAPLEYPRTHLPASVRMVGPGDWDPDTDVPPDWLAELRDPLIVVSASSVYQNDAALIQTALDALADEAFGVGGNNGVAGSRPVSGAGQRGCSAVRVASVSAATSGGGSLPRGNGDHPEGTSRGRAGLYRAVRP